MRTHYRKWWCVLLLYECNAVFAVLSWTAKTILLYVIRNQKYEGYAPINNDQYPKYI